MNTHDPKFVAGSPILYIRNRLQEQKRRLGPNARAELIFRAWNCSVRGESIRTLPVHDADLPKLEMVG